MLLKEAEDDDNDEDVTEEAVRIFWFLKIPRSFTQTVFSFLLYLFFDGKHYLKDRSFFYQISLVRCTVAKKGYYFTK